MLNGVICSLQESSVQEEDWLAGSPREMIRIQRMKAQCTERDKPARNIFTEGRVEIAQYGWEKVGSNKWSAGKERNPTDFKNTHY